MEVTTHVAPLTNWGSASNMALVAQVNTRLPTSSHCSYKTPAPVNLAYFYCCISGADLALIEIYNVSKKSVRGVMMPQITIGAPTLKLGACEKGADMFPFCVCFPLQKGKQLFNSGNSPVIAAQEASPFNRATYSFALS
jgi:hypothetical protein